MDESETGDSTVRHTWLFNVMLTYYSTDFQIVRDIIAPGCPRIKWSDQLWYTPPAYDTLGGIWRSAIRRGNCGGATRWLSPATQS